MRHHPRFTDVPIWLRVSDVEGKNITFVNMANLGKTPTNAKIKWSRYHPRMIELLQAGMEPPEIAVEIGLPRHEVVAKCWDLMDAGKVVFGMKT